MKKHSGLLLVAALVLLTVTPSLMAQGFQVGTITGTVTDQTGAALPGVTVSVTNQERKTTRTDTTDAQGHYRLAGLALATYRVEGVLSGFGGAAKQNIRVEAETATVVDLVMKLAAQTESITVTAQAPVVDRTNQAQTTNVSNREWEKAPVGRSYQAIAALAPGVSANNGGNPYSNGANYTTNQFLFDGVDATDPTTGTFGSNVNFEAIQEVTVFTSGVSAEYGRATGAIISIITKSGTNSFDGSLKMIGTNDNWDAQNSTRDMITGSSFARTKVQHNNIRYSGTLGGPIWKDHAWFFGALEKYKPLTSPATTTYTHQNYNSAQDLKLENYRADWQITPSQHIWGKWQQDPYTGIARTYTEATDLYTITLQGQGGKTSVAQYNAVFGSNFSLDAEYGTSTSKITVDPFMVGPYDNGAAIYDVGINKYFNGNYFGAGNYVERPKKQFIVAGTYFATLGGNNHEFKAGVDDESVKSTSYYTYGNNREYDVTNYDPATGTFTPGERYDFDNPGPQTSKGDILSFYARDKFALGRRLNLEVGLRYENQTGHNDVGTKVVSARTFAPRLSASYDLVGDGRTLLLGTAGRYYDFLIQSFSDQYAQSASRANYNLYEWNTATKQYDFVQHVITASGSTLPVSLGLKPNKLDEITIGAERQLGSTMGVTVRGIYRKWADQVEDFIEFNSAGNPVTTYRNNSGSERTYRALQAQFDKRFSNRWSLLANYTYSKTKGNYFATLGGVQGDYLNSNCRVNDASIGTIPCSQVMATANGLASWDRPHVLNVVGTYGWKLGRVNLTYGLGGIYRSGAPYSKAAAVSVIRPNGSALSGYSYYYQGIGSDRLPNVYQIDNSFEATFGIIGGAEIGLKGEIFNITDNQVQILANRTTWCAANTTACATTRSQFGAATARTAFNGPRNYRLTALIRF